jgi:uncharacterized protein YeeX (DUF496 family)
MVTNRTEFSLDGDQLTLGMDITKVDKERRQVVGFAILDNLDQQGDVVLPEASWEAFSSFKRNLREMHQPIAVGRVLDFKEDTFFDPETQKAYTGILVTAYVSKGAQSTWEKVLDGTLQGFSIGARVNKSDRRLMKNRNGDTQVVRIIEKYTLNELSLVDSPANQLSSILSIVKADGVYKATGIATEVESTNVFWCDDDKVAKVSSDDTADCALCSTSMKNIGWFELDESEPVTEKISSVIEKYTTRQVTASDEGGVEVADAVEATEKEQSDTDIERSGEVGGEGKLVDEKVEDTAVEKSVEGADEAADDAEAGADAEAEGAEGEEAAAEEADADAAGDADDSPDFQKVLGELRELITDGLDKQSLAVAESIQKAVESFAGRVDDLVVKHTELVTKQDALSVKLDEATASFADVTKRLGDAESSGAVKKSADLGGSTEDGSTNGRPTGTWQGVFLDK